MKNDVKMKELGLVLLGGWALLYFIILPLLFVMDGERPMPWYISFPLIYAVGYIVLNCSRHYWTKDIDDGRDSESEG